MRLVTSIKKDSNKLRDLSEFRRQKVDIYLTTDETDPPGPHNFQMHKVINFDTEKNGYDKEYEVNPKFHFIFNLPASKVLSDKIFIRLIGSKACEIEMIAQLTLDQEAMQPNDVELPVDPKYTIKNISRELEAYFQANTD